MKTYKIIHKERDHAQKWREVNSIVPAQSRYEAIKKLDRHPDLIKSIKLLTAQEPSISTKQTYSEYWDVWNEKIKSSQKKKTKFLYDLTWRKKTNKIKDENQDNSTNKKNT